MTAILDNLKRIYLEVSNASLCFELTIEEIIKFTDIQEIILNTMETDLLLDQQRELIESIHKKKLNLTVIVSTFNNWNNDIFSLVSNIIVVINNDIGVINNIESLDEKKKDKMSVIIEVNDNNYFQLEEIIYQVFSTGIKNLELSITQTAKNDFSYKNAFTVIKKYVDIKKIFPNINITSDMKKINKYVNKSIIENAFVNYEGYVGILNCLPTYFENINEISFDVALDRYLKLYFHQDIQFYKTRLGTVEHINNLKAIRNEIFKYGFYNITVLEIKKNWKLWYGKTNIYLIDSITSNKIKLNRVAAVLIESIDGRRSIKEIVEIIGLSYQDKSRINFECISTILQLIKEGVLYPLKIRVVTE